MQLSITSVVELDPVTARHPDLPDGVTAEACGDLDPIDPEAFDAMLTASRTNPRPATAVMTRDEMRGWVDDGEVPLGTLVRVEGLPAAITFGSVVPGDGIRRVNAAMGIARSTASTGCGRGCPSSEVERPGRRVAQARASRRMTTSSAAASDSSTPSTASRKSSRDRL